MAFRNYARYRRDLFESGNRPDYSHYCSEIPEWVWENYWGCESPDEIEDEEYNLILDTPNCKILVPSIDFEFECWGTNEFSLPTNPITGECLDRKLFQINGIEYYRFENSWQVTDSFKLGEVSILKGISDEKLIDEIWKALGRPQERFLQKLIVEDWLVDRIYINRKKDDCPVFYLELLEEIDEKVCSND
jgi:hypothetical protein